MEIVQKHDELIHREVQELSNDCDVILFFAQFSMARALETLDITTIPILTSPEISVKSIVAEISKKGDKCIINVELMEVTSLVNGKLVTQREERIMEVISLFKGSCAL
ncbi:hypothetical protein GCM10020331_086080 [Ectobacillus funiculus]